MIFCFRKSSRTGGPADFFLSFVTFETVKIPVPTRQAPTEGNLEDNMNNKRKPRGGANRSDNRSVK